MPFLQLRRPLQAVAAASRWRPSAPSTIPCLSDLLGRLRLDGGASGAGGRRYASVKSQGAYKLKWKRTIPKKMGAKKTGDQYVIPGNIIYKQRGTIWHPGENTIMGRDHTIHAAVAGYVKYYRDPTRHPTRQYIGVTFEREDKLPYPQNAVRRRRLGLEATPRRPEASSAAAAGAAAAGEAVSAAPAMTASGIPLWVVRREGPAAELAVTPDEGGETTATPASASETAAQSKRSKKSQAKLNRARLLELRVQRRRAAQSTRVLHLQSDYSYREYNWEIGRLVGPAGRVAGTTKISSRKAKFRARRRRRVAEFRRLKAEAAQRRALRRASEAQEAEREAARAAETARASKKQKAQKEKKEKKAA